MTSLWTELRIRILLSAEHHRGSQKAAIGRGTVLVEVSEGPHHCCGSGADLSADGDPQEVTTAFKSYTEKVREKRKISLLALESMNQLNCCIFSGPPLQGQWVQNHLTNHFSSNLSHNHEWSLKTNVVHLHRMGHLSYRPVCSKRQQKGSISFALV